MELDLTPIVEAAAKAHLATLGVDIAQIELGTLMGIKQALIPITQAVVAATREQVAMELGALASKWEAQQYVPAGLYHEATAYASARDDQAEACADELRATLEA